MRREIRLGSTFDAEAFERACTAFRELYNVEPQRALCAPDVLARFCDLYERAHHVHQHSTRLAFRGIPLTAAILAPGTVAFEGEIDPARMGDW